MAWHCSRTVVLMATVKGMVITYDVASRYLSPPQQSKHPRSIVCGAWGPGGLLALGSSSLVPLRPPPTSVKAASRY